jgi:predicted transcriptional regulator
MKQLTAPGDAELREAASDCEWTVGAPADTTELSDEDVERLTYRVLRVKNTQGERPTVVKMLETREDGSEVRNFRIDFEELLKILYEHRRYERARGFTDAEMDVLRAIEFADAERVTIDEIMDDNHAEEYSEAAVYKSLRTLQEKTLIEKIKPGLYRYREC